MGNSVRVTRNNFYGNANGLTTDTISASGHPGFPADGMKIDNNWFYSNNLDIYTDDPEFEPLVPQPVGTGFWWPGHNNGRFKNNWVFDNWRYGTFLISIPDAVAGEAEGAIDPGIHCPSADEGVSTSCDNQYSKNHMGEVPPGFKPHGQLTMFGNETSLAGSPATAPNGIDFWWDEATPNTGNCWFENTGTDGTRDSLTGDPAIGPAPGQSIPGFLPEDCATSVGSAAYGGKAPALLGCYVQYETDNLDSGGCTWFDTPAQPGGAESRAQLRQEQRQQKRFAASDDGRKIQEWIEDLSGEVSFGPEG
jgi:hypothetical protein